MIHFSERFAKQIFPSAVIYSKHIAAVVAFGVMGVIAALLGGPSADDTRDRTEDWTLPKDNPVVLTSTVQEMLAQPIFGGTPVLELNQEDEQDSEDEAPRGTWRLIGILTEGSEQTILLENEETGKIENAKLGDTLPGGEKLSLIKAGSIEVLIGDENIQLSLFQDLEKTEE